MRAADREVTTLVRKARRRRGKYGAQRTNGFASKLESRTNDELCAALTGRNPALATLLGVQAGDTLTTQHRISFACGTYHLVDFAIWRDGVLVALVESKGAPLPTWRIKMKLLKHEHPAHYAKYFVAYGNQYRLIGDGIPSKRERRSKKKGKAA